MFGTHVKNKKIINTIFTNQIQKNILKNEKS
jgi:hypothetical protein